MDDIKKSKMLEFWSERAILYGTDPRANTNDIWLREVELKYLNRVIQQRAPKTILDFGCANGFSTARVAELNPDIAITGVDINSEMVLAANEYAARLSNLTFSCLDIMRQDVPQTFDFIYAVRVFQNIENADTQKRAVDRLIELIAPGGALVYVESYADGYAQINSDRIDLDLEPLPIHPHLTLLTDDFDRHVAKSLRLVGQESLSSSYYLVTRLLYSYIAKINNEPIDYNHTIHRLAAMLPQIGTYGPQRACLFVRD